MSWDEKIPIVRKFMYDWRTANKYERRFFFFMTFSWGAFYLFIFDTVKNNKPIMDSIMSFLVYFLPWFFCYWMIKKFTQKRTLEIDTAKMVVKSDEMD